MVRHLVVGALLLAFCARAEAQDTRTVCEGGADRDRVISACSDIIADKSNRDSVLATAHVRRGALRLTGNDITGAREDFDAAIILDGQNAAAYLGRAQAAIVAEHPDQALADFAAAEKLEPKAPALHLARAQFYLSQHRYTEAAADADLDRYPMGMGTTFLILRCRARAYGGFELDKGRQACDEALWAQPGQLAVTEARGIIALKQKRYPAALTDFTSLSTSQPRVARAWYGKGLAEIGLGRADDGKADIAHAQQINANIATVYSELGLPPG